MRRPNSNVLPERAGEIWDGAQSPTGSERTVRVRCTLITPMHGGGVTAGEVDRDMPIRASALRGQLRFWWRLLNGVNRSSSNLFADESNLWGGISSGGPQASQVTLQVGSTPVGDRQLITKSELYRENPPGFPAYALILDPGKDPSFLKAGYTFDLVLLFKRSVEGPQREGVMEALRWWASFAGVGARTRRGFGAVKADVRELKPVSIEEVGRHGGWMVVGSPAHDATMAWKNAIDALQQFRQGKNVGRNPGSGIRPGRSRWPEADTIRRIKNTHAPGHEPEHRVDGFYPRAAFGLPLVFHFKNNRRGDPKGKHSESPVLNPVGGERMASPLILRPWFDGEQYRPAALLLPGWEARVSVPVSLDSEQETPAWPGSPSERKPQAQQIKPMFEQGADDALSAFMGYFEKQTGGAR